MDLSVIIVSFRNKEKTWVTLDALFNSQTNFNFEVILVDNDSRDGTAEMVETDFPKVKLIRNKNEGFSKANNRGLRVASGEYVLLLNPDTAVQPNTLQKCLEKIKSDPKIGILTCKLLKEDGSLDPAARRNIPNPWNSLTRFLGLARIFPKSKVFADYNLGHISADKEHQVGAVNGAFMLLPKTVIDQVGYLDEDFFLYGEDLDWCYRVGKAGYKIIYYPEVFTYHFKGQSSRKTPYIALHAFHSAMWIFYKKHYAKQYPFFMNWLVWLGIWSRFAFLLAINFFRKNKVVSK